MTAIDATIERLLAYVDRRRAISFGEVYGFVAAHRLCFGAAANPIEVLDLAAYETGRIDVNYDTEMICVRHEPRPASVPATVTAMTPLK